MRLVERLLAARDAPAERSSFPGLSWDTVQGYFGFDGTQYPLTTWGRTNDRLEEAPRDFGGYAASLAKRNGIVGALLTIRLMLFSQAWPMWQRLNNGLPGDLFSTADLDLLRAPWPNGSAQELLGRMCQDTDLAGNAYLLRRGDRLVRLRPDWVDIVLVGDDPDVEVLGYLYRPGGEARRAQAFPVGEVAHWCPLPDPEARYRGMSWLTPVVREVMGDSKMTDHKGRFLDNAATPNMVVKWPEVSKEQFDLLVETFERGHRGLAHAYKTLHLGGGADATVVGRDLQQLDFKVVQGAGETRIAAAAGVPPVIVGFSEGLAGSSLNAGNYGQARRRLADGTLHPLWGSAFEALAKLLRSPSTPGSAARLWYAAGHIPFLREDVKDQADIVLVEAQALRTLLDAGYSPDAATRAVAERNIGLLAGEHSGLFSVQLQAPGADTQEAP